MLCLIIFLAKPADLDRASFEYTEGISADETLFARSLAHSITEDVCREKGVSVEKVAQLKKQVEEGILRTGSHGHCKGHV